MIVQVLAASAAASTAPAVTEPAVSPPVPLNAATWFRPEDYPPQALRSLERGYVLFRLVVSPEGRVVGCSTSGKSALDRAFCSVVVPRARFRPAIGIAGEPVHAVYENAGEFVLSGTTRPTPPERANFVLVVDRLPRRVAQPAYSKIAVLIGHDGSIRHYVPMRYSSTQPDDVVRFLGKAACGQLASAYRPEVVKDAGGRAVDHVRTVLVKFEAMKAK